MKRRRVWLPSITIVLVVCVFIFVPPPPAWASEGQLTLPFSIESHVRLLATAKWSEMTVRPGEMIELQGDPIKKRLVIRINNKRNILLKTLQDLQGFVEIGNTKMALGYVRLRTAYSTWNKWPGSQAELEIVPASQVKTIPDYGLKPEMSPSNMYSGFLGVLSSQAFQQGGFSAPVIHTLPTGYQITRWLFVEEASKTGHKLSVQQVEEFVGSSGQYRRHVLQKHAIPHLPKTTWTLDVFE